MSITAVRSGYYPGEIVHVKRYPFVEDPRQYKSRYALVVEVNATNIVVRGIYTRAGQGRKPITAERGTGLHHNSFVGTRRETFRAHEVRHHGETRHDFDPYGDFA
jgi:hypothetical protein